MWWHLIGWTDAGEAITWAMQHQAVRDERRHRRQHEAAYGNDWEFIRPWPHEGP